MNIKEGLVNGDFRVIGTLYGEDLQVSTVNGTNLNTMITNTANTVVSNSISNGDINTVATNAANTAITNSINSGSIKAALDNVKKKVIVIS